MDIKNRLLETFRRKVQILKKKKSKFSYGISIFSLNPRINEQFFGEGITFQPTGTNSIDFPLLFSKNEKIFEETIEYLFDISIQERVLQEDGNFQGLFLFDLESSIEAKAVITFGLHSLSEDSNEDKYIIELPESNFDYDATKSIYNQYIDKKFPNLGYSYSTISTPKLELRLFHPHNAFGVNGEHAYNSESFDFTEIFSETGNLDNKPKPEPFSILKQFEISKHITLKLLDYKTSGRYTRIYVNGTQFLQCAYILFNNPQDHAIQSEINSIDEASDKLDSKMEFLFGESSFASPESLFWAHCSNIQVWCELGYDSRVLHSNLSFPLLRELFKAGDIKAKRVYKEEIAKRLLDQYPPVIIYLLKEKYLDYLDNSEIEVVFYELDEQVSLPNSRLINQELANILLEVGQNYINNGLEYGSLAINLSQRIKDLLSG